MALQGNLAMIHDSEKEKKTEMDTGVAVIGVIGDGKLAEDVGRSYRKCLKELVNEEAKSATISIKIEISCAKDEACFVKLAGDVKDQVKYERIRTKVGFLEPEGQMRIGEKVI